MNLFVKNTTTSLSTCVYFSGHFRLLTHLNKSFEPPNHKLVQECYMCVLAYSFLGQSILPAQGQPQCLFQYQDGKNNSWTHASSAVLVHNSVTCISKVAYPCYGTLKDSGETNSRSCFLQKQEIFCKVINGENRGGEHWVTTSSFMFQCMFQNIQCQPGQGSSVKKSTVPKTKPIIQGKLHFSSFQKTQQQYTTCQQFLNKILPLSMNPLFTQKVKKGFELTFTAHTEELIDHLVFTVKRAAT